jgi:hypothetical protein
MLNGSDKDGLVLRTAKWSTLIFLLMMFFGPTAHAQSLGGVFNAASCLQADVNAVINGPLHVAVNGDTIQLPPGNCTWNTGITVPKGVGITIVGAGTPDSNPADFTPSSSCQQTVITMNSTASIFSMSPTYGSSLSRISCMKLIPGTTGMAAGANIQGTCTASGCPNFREDNLTLPTAWGDDTAADHNFSVVNNVWGVADHNAVGDVPPVSSYIALVNVNNSAWQGVGAYGDNSWASPDTFGTNEAFYIENNTFTWGGGTDTDNPGGGGGRFVCRFNIWAVAGNGGLCANHGTDTTQRTRGARQEENYANNMKACGNASGYTCPVIYEMRSGVGMIFGNTIASSIVSGYKVNGIAELSAYRQWEADTPWGGCNGSSPWDTNDGGSTPTVYYSGTIGSVNTSTDPWTITDSGSPGWTTNQWSPLGGQYSWYDTSKRHGIPIGSNKSNVLTTIFIDDPSKVGFTPAAGDSYVIYRATVCMDQPTRSGGNLVQNNGGGNPVLASTGNPGPVNESLDPLYEWDDAPLPSGRYTVGGAANIIANRDYYSQSNGQTAQTSPTSPFNGTSGTGWGPLADRPTTCTTGVGYWATDQGNWNQTSNTYYGGYTQGELFTCVSTNTWSSSPTYVPYTYPHPLVSGDDRRGNGPSAPTGLTATVQ